MLIENKLSRDGWGWGWVGLGGWVSPVYKFRSYYIVPRDYFDIDPVGFSQEEKSPLNILGPLLI